ncbi:MAG: RNA polymerase sigma factor [Acidobacteria bacterium]|nr:RNA polymerase sigma factor [Acidobacteriota bacterium]
MLAADFPPTLDQVVRQREKQVLRTAYRITGNWADAEDVAQEVFVRLHRHGLDFPNEAAMGSWILRVTTNLCLDRARRTHPIALDPEITAGGKDVREEAILEQEKQRLMAALAQLPEKERAAVVLREIEGVDTAGVAAALGSSESTVRSQVSRALGRLRELLKEMR